MTTSASGNIADSADFQKASAGYFLYPQKYIQREAIMKANPRLVLVAPNGDIFDFNPALVFNREKAVGSLTSKLRNIHDPTCRLYLHPFEMLYEQRSSTAASLNWKKITCNQLTVFPYLLRMEMQYLSGCSVEWQPDGRARPAAAADAEDQSEHAAGQSGRYGVHPWTRSPR